MKKTILAAFISFTLTLSFSTLAFSCGGGGMAKGNSGMTAQGGCGGGQGCGGQGDTGCGASAQGGHDTATHGAATGGGCSMDVDGGAPMDAGASQGGSYQAPESTGYGSTDDAFRLVAARCGWCHR